MRISRGMLAVIVALTQTITVMAATPLETVRAFQKACVAKDTDTALTMITKPPGDGEKEDGYFLQKARSLVESTGSAEGKLDVAAQKTGNGVAVVVVTVTGPGDKVEVDPLYLRKSGKRWRIIPFSNWRKLPVTAEEKTALEELEKWYDAEEARRNAKEDAPDESQTPAR